MLNIKERVLKLIKKNGTNCPFQIAKRRNIVILNEPLGNILGYYNLSWRTQMIHLNEQLDSHMRRFVCAHELGHSILHPDVNTPFLRRNTLFSIDKIEREANTFAIELVITDESLFELGCSTSFEVARAFGIPHELVSLKNLHI